MSQDVILHGFHAVIARLRQAPADIRELLVDAARQDGRMRDLLRAAETAGVRFKMVDAARLNGLAAGARHQGVVALARALPAHLTPDDVLDSLAPNTAPLLLALDGVTDPHNLGAALRVADAAGVHAVIAPKDRACGLNATVRKVASGAAESLPYLTVTNLARSLRALKERGLWVVGATGEATHDLYATDCERPLVWVLGAEGAGLRRLTLETCDELARIPMYGSVSSLNVSVAAGICLFETRRQRRAAHD